MEPGRVARMLHTLFKLNEKEVYLRYSFQAFLCIASGEHGTPARWARPERGLKYSLSPSIE
jgi:hypothetical protein